MCKPESVRNLPPHLSLDISEKIFVLNLGVVVYGFRAKNLSASVESHVAYLIVRVRGIQFIELCTCRSANAYRVVNDIGAIPLSNMIGARAGFQDLILKPVPLITMNGNRANADDSCVSIVAIIRNVIAQCGAPVHDFRD